MPCATASKEGMSKGLYHWSENGWSPANSPYPQKPSSTAYSNTSSAFCSRAAMSSPRTAISAAPTRTTRPSRVHWTVESASRRRPAMLRRWAWSSSWMTDEPVTVVVYAMKTTVPTVFTQPVRNPSQGLRVRPTHR